MGLERPYLKAYWYYQVEESVVVIDEAGAAVELLRTLPLSSARARGFCLPLPQALAQSRERQPWMPLQSLILP